MANLTIQPYDLFILAVLVLAVSFGAWKGAAWQVASLASLVVSFMVALHASSPLAPLISANEPWNRFIAMLILYLATSAAIWLLFRLVAKVLDRMRLKEFDRQVGALLGLAKGVLLCLVITFFVVTLSEPARQSILRSYSGHYMTLLIQKADGVMPAEVRAVVGKYMDQLKDGLNRPADALPVHAGPSGMGPETGLPGWGEDVLNGRSAAETANRDARNLGL